MDKIRVAIQQMIDAGEPEEKIQEFVRRAKEKLAAKKEDSLSHVDAIFNVQNSIKKDNQKVIDRSVQEYFSLDNIPRKYERVQGRQGAMQVLLPPTEEDIQEFFGERKYNEYKAFQNENILPVDDEKYKAFLDQNQRQVKKEASEQYINNNVPKKEREQAILSLPDVIDDEDKEVTIDGKTYKNPQELYNNMIKKSPDKAMRFQQDYLNSVNKSYKDDVLKYNKAQANFDKNNASLIKEQNNITNEFKKLGDVNENSPQDLIDKYNALVAQQVNLNNTLKANGSLALQDQLIETRNNLNTRFEDLMSKSKTFNNSSMAAKALGLDYSFGGALSLQLERAFLGSGAVLGAGAMKLIGKAATMDLDGIDNEQESKIYNWLDKNYKNAINYNDELSKKIETTLPTQIKVKDIDSKNILMAGKQMLANNSPSILVAFGTMGYGSVASRGLGAAASIAARKKAANLGMAAFFEMEAGGKLADIEIAEKYAAENIAALEIELAKPNLTPDQKINIKKSIAENKNALSHSAFEKAFSSIAYGGIASYAERLGTLSYMNGLSKYNRVVGGNVFKKGFYGAKGSVYNVGIELLEETATQLGHNLVDIAVLNEDKSLIEGLDADFLVNTAFTSLAIQGPSMGMNSYNALKGEVNTLQERSQNKARTQELLEIQEMLKSGKKMSTKQRKSLVDRKRQILKDAALEDVTTVQKLARMTPQEVTDLFEANRLRRKTLRELQELGSLGDSQSKFNKKQREDLNKKYKEHDNKREFLLGRPKARLEKEIQAKLKARKEDIELGVDMDPTNEADIYFQAGKYQFNVDILKNAVGDKNLKIFKGENTREQLIDYLGEKVKNNTISQEDANKALFSNNFAFNVGSDVVLLEDEIQNGILAGGASAMFAASSPLHELLHRELRKAGIVVDGEIVKSAENAVASIEQHLNSLGENNLIDKNTAKVIQKRIDAYRSKDGVDLEELITLVGDLKDQGIINRQSMSITYDLQSLMKGLSNKFLGKKEMFLGFDTVDDVFRYIDSFQGKTKEGALIIPPEEDKEKVSIKASKSNLQSMLDTQYEGDVRKMGRDAISVDTQGKRLEGEQAFNLMNSRLGKDIGPMITDITQKLYDPIVEKGELTRQEYQNALIGIASEIIRTENFDPTIQSLDKFVSSRLYFRANSLAAKLGVPQQFTKDIDNIEDPTTDDIPDTETDTRPRSKPRQLTSLSNVYRAVTPVDLNNKIQALIVKNPDNLEKQLEKLILKEVTKAVQGEMGTISFTDGKVEVSEQYQEYINLSYESIISGLDVATIKNNYNQLFDLKEIGKEDKKTKKEDKPTLKKDSNFRKGVFEITGNKAKFIKFFTDTSSLGRDGNPLAPQSHYNKIRDRQKKLAIIIAETVTENVINSNIVENSKDMNAIVRVKMKEFANSLNRQKKEIQGNYNDVLKFSLNSMKDANMLKDLVTRNGLSKVFNDQGKLLPEVKETLLEKRSNKAADFIYSIAKQGFIQDLSDLQYISKLYQKIYKAGKRGEAFEASIIDTIKELEKEFGEATVYAVLRKPTEADALPDVVMKIHNTLLNIEAKMSNAQYSSVTFAVDGKNNFYIKKDYSFNDQILGLGKQVQEGINAAKSYLKKKYKYNWENISLIPTEYYEDLKNTPVKIGDKEFSSYVNAMSATMEIPLDVVSEIYNKKKHPVNYMHMMGRGLFYMGGHNDVTNILGVPELKGNAEITLRVGSNSQYKTVDGVRSKTGNKRLSFRAIPTIPKKTLETLKPHDKTLDSKEGIRNIINSKEGQLLSTMSRANNANTLKKAATKARETIKPSKGITILDFDDTLATTKSLVKYTAPDGTVGTLNAEQFASTYEDLQDQGYVFDFSDFNKVVKGKLAPLFNKAIKLQGKFGPENMFVLTARPPQAAQAIYDFLTANGLNIPLKNITGLGDSTAEGKALWVADKVAEGYNDFYFADDALQNVQAVKNMLDQFDVKSKVQQAKVKFSKDINTGFNDILQDVTGIDSKKRFSDIKARKRGASKGKFRFFIPPSHEDFVGLLYNFIGKGRQGDAHRDFFEENLIRPLNRAYRELNTAKQSIANDYKSLNKRFPEVKKKLTKKTPDGDFTYQDAIRVYLFNKHGHSIPGLSETDQNGLVDLVMKDVDLRTYAETLNVISKQDAYVSPSESWDAGDIRTDLDDATGRIGREQFFEEFFENANIIFSPENMNKIEAAYGAGMVSALKDILHRTKTGRNRPSGQNKMVNQFMNYLNGSVGATMFFNIRSSVLQQMSLVNFINFSDNNVLAAATAFANQKQYWKDWAMLFNSDFMKQRRGGIQTDVNGAELAASVKGAQNPAQAVIKKLLEIGFLPTQIGDNIAIATGGAAFYRNRVKTYTKQGMSQKEAESKAFIDFQGLAEATQQSARPDMVSQQQASPLGKIILAFQNVTSQFNRLGKKAFLDLKNRRISPEYKNASNPQFQSDIGNVSRIAYYFAIQNLIFYALQSALFAAMFDDDEEDERFLKKRERMISGSIDSVLRGAGVWGAAVATLKNMAIKWHEQRDKGYNKDESAVLMEMLNVSPPLGIKARKLVNAEKTLNYNAKVIKEMETFDIDNPQWSAVTNYIEATTNIPLNRLYNKTINVRDALDSQHSAMERALMFAGWSKWNLGIPDQKLEKVKKKIKFGDKAKLTPSQKLFGLNKDQQIKMLSKFGVSKYEINKLKLEKDRVQRILSEIEKRNK